MIELERLKIKREYTLLLHDLEKEKDNKKWTTKLSYFLIKYFEYFDDVTIIQYSRFGFVITYVIYVKDKKIISFDEELLSNGYNRTTMNKLILSKLNKSRHNSYKIKNNIREISEIDY